MDRREALKKMAAAGVVIAGASTVMSTTAFADGGTASKRPTCNTAAGSYVTWSTPSGGYIRFATNPGTVSCPTGWTGSVAYRFILTTGSGVFKDPNATNIVNPPAADTGWIAPGTRSASNGIRLLDTASATSLTSQTIALSIVVRRMCSNNALTSRKAWCCVAFTKSAAFVNGSSDNWGGTNSGNFGVGTADPATGCDAP